MPPAFIGWRLHPQQYGFPEYYFDNASDYWRRYEPGKNVLLVQNQESERQDRTRTIEQCVYGVTPVWRSMETIELLQEFDAWDFLVTDNSEFCNSGAKLLGYLATRARPGVKKVHWIVVFSYASSLERELAALITRAKIEAGATFIPGVSAHRGLREYFGKVYGLLELPRPACTELRTVVAPTFAFPKTNGDGSAATERYSALTHIKMCEPHVSRQLGQRANGNGRE